MTIFLKKENASFASISSSLLDLHISHPFENRLNCAGDLYRWSGMVFRPHPQACQWRKPRCHGSRMELWNPSSALNSKVILRTGFHTSCCILYLRTAACVNVVLIQCRVTLALLRLTGFRGGIWRLLRKMATLLLWGFGGRLLCSSCQRLSAKGLTDKQHKLCYILCVLFYFQ